MKTKVLKEFSSFMADAQLTVTEFTESLMKVYELRTWTRIQDDSLSHNYQASNFGESEHDAKVAFSQFVKHWI